MLVPLILWTILKLFGILESVSSSIDLLISLHLLFVQYNVRPLGCTMSLKLSQALMFFMPCGSENVLHAHAILCTLFDYDHH